MRKRQPPKIALRSARSAETPTEPPIPASQVQEAVPPSLAVQQPAPTKRTVAALDRNLLAVQELIERTARHIESARQLPTYERTTETIPSLQKQLANLEGRKGILERLRAKEVRYTDL